MEKYQIKIETKYHLDSSEDFYSLRAEYANEMKESYANRTEIIYGSLVIIHEHSFEFNEIEDYHRFNNRLTNIIREVKTV